MTLLYFTFFAFIGFVCAWLPHERHLFGEPASTTFTAGHGRSVKRFSPNSTKIRGVNLGSLFIIEPWMVASEWKSMGCGSAQSEFDCVSALGQDAANTAFQNHWSTYVTEDDLDTMKSYGLNTVRVPIGYWMFENLVYNNSEHFPQGGLKYLDQLVGWAAEKSIYVILDLHGAPGAQDPKQPFTGQYASQSGFFQTYQYERAWDFLTNITTRIHQNSAYSTVGMLEILNEPESGHSDLVSTYYATAISKIRDTESKLGVSQDKQLTIQMMGSSWGGYNPQSVGSSDKAVAYDNHRYLKWDSSVAETESAYLAASCSDTFSDATPVLIGEWSLSISDTNGWDGAFQPTNATSKAWYKQWWAAQVLAYEKELGWVFWSWKMEGDIRWSYSDAVKAGVIPEDPTQASSLANCGSS